MHTFQRSAPQTALAAVIAIACFSASSAGVAQIPYNNAGPFLLPISGPGLPSPAQVRGKQYSHNSDQAVGGVADPAQVISWDGLGGTLDNVDFSSPAPPYSPNGIFQVDALANDRDALFNETLQEAAHLAYSVDHRATRTLGFGLTPFTLPSGFPLTVFDTIKGGTQIIGGAGEISYEFGRFGGLLPINKHGLWATQAQINGSPLPVNLDALELWGGEPGSIDENDSTKYSVDTDSSTATANQAYSVWTYRQSGHTGYVPQAMVVDLVRNLLNAPNLAAEQVDLDALMVMDSDSGGGQGTGPNFFNAGDKIIFSIRQLPAAAAPGGFIATGSEIFVLDGASTAATPVGNFLVHGGHTWDKAYALANMVARFQGFEGPTFDVQLDLNSLEAIAGVPEPGSAMLAMFGCVLIAAIRKRRRSSC